MTVQSIPTLPSRSYQVLGLDSIISLEGQALDFLLNGQRGMETRAGSPVGRVAAHAGG
jgi:hypothetical protein